MARVKSRKYPVFVSRLHRALRAGLNQAGIEAAIRHENVPSTKLYRFLVVAKKFENMAPSERQHVVWRLADQVLSEDEQMLVSMILTLTPDEVEGS
jgi:hypothetical protein